MTRIEYDAAHDGLHVSLTCDNHPTLRWSCKKIATSPDTDDAGILRYNGMRHLFYDSHNLGLECPCSARYLRVILED